MGRPGVRSNAITADQAPRAWPAADRSPQRPRPISNMRLAAANGWRRTEQLFSGNTKIGETLSQAIQQAGLLGAPN